ncbi:MAG: biotin/lipoyl-containing protein [Lysinibacillus sp.]
MVEVKAQMAGSIFEVKVKVGDVVETGQIVVILESMKMEIPVEVERAGVVSAVLKVEGDFVNEDETLIVLT